MWPSAFVFRGKKASSNAEPSSFNILVWCIEPLAVLLIRDKNFFPVIVYVTFTAQCVFRCIFILRRICKIGKSKYKLRLVLPPVCIEPLGSMNRATRLPLDGFL
jgi:hypothetical protein